MFDLAVRDISASEMDFGMGTIVADIKIGPSESSRQHASARAKGWSDATTGLLQYLRGNSVLRFPSLDLNTASTRWLELDRPSDAKRYEQWMTAFLLAGARIGDGREELKPAFRQIDASQRLTLFLLEAMSFLPTAVKPYVLSSGEEVLDIVLENGRLSCVFDETYFQLLSDSKGEIEQSVLYGDEYTLENVRTAIAKKVADLKQQ